MDHETVFRRPSGARFGVAPSSVVKWTQRAWRLDQVQACPHITLATLQEMLADRGIAMSHDTVWRFLRGYGFSFQKRR